MQLIGYDDDIIGRGRGVPRLPVGAFAPVSILPLAAGRDLRVARALLVFLWYGGAESEGLDINQSFFILFMVIIGGLGSLLGSYMGAALIFILPIILRTVPTALGLPLRAATVEHLTFITVGALIIAFLVVEPMGLARLWQVGKQKLRVWPFPY